MDITFVIRPDADRTRRGVLATMHEYRRRVLVYGIVEVAAGTLVAVFGFTVGPPLIGWMGVLMGVLSPTTFYAPRILARGAARAVKGRGVSRTIRLTDTEAITEKQHTQTRLQWSSLARIDERDGFWIARAGRQLLLS